MRCYLLSVVLGFLLFGGALPAPAQTTSLVGTWRSGNFAYTFNGDGTYVYVGAMGASTMQTQISEQGTYSVSGNVLTVARKRGVITNTNNYRQVLGAEVTTFPFRAGNTPNGPALQLTFPDGRGQVFYRQ